MSFIFPEALCVIWTLYSCKYYASLEWRAELSAPLEIQEKLGLLLSLKIDISHASNLQPYF